MTTDERWIDETFDKLRSRGATCGESFSDELEDRLMKEQQQQPARTRRRRFAWAAGLAILVAGLAGGAYAGGNAVMNWIYPMTINFGEDGKVRNADGDVVGETVENFDGTFSSTVYFDEANHIVLEGVGPAPTGNLHFAIGPADEPAEDTSESEEPASE
jgi:hypothetical protein